MRRWHTLAQAPPDWGPYSAWVGDITTLMVVTTTSLVALGWFERFRAPCIAITFQGTEPWRRTGRLSDGTEVVWVRLGVENHGKSAAVGCVGRVISVTTEGSHRADVDPVQLRWAGVPRSRAFQPIDLRPGQREYLNVLLLPGEGNWRLVTFEDPDFDPGFTTELPRGQSHLVQVSVFATNAKTGGASLMVQAPPEGGDLTIRLV
ncbi:hypothetical protein [Rhizomonospora bruguierae]|uniref:hypothetical protein n=1 Tax=Rhizomonospora bruguierae TaxID=1581705 RepID=UPI001BCAF1A9|nr:hypothetical protein [Micromonospora sp. NBRC 107566]